MRKGKIRWAMGVGGDGNHETAFQNALMIIVGLLFGLLVYEVQKDVHSSQNERNTCTIAK